MRAQDCVRVEVSEIMEHHPHDVARSKILAAVIWVAVDQGWPGDGERLLGVPTVGFMVDRQMAILVEAGLLRRVSLSVRYHTFLFHSTCGGRAGRGVFLSTLEPRGICKTVRECAVSPLTGAASLARRPMFHRYQCKHVDRTEYDLQWLGIPLFCVVERAD
jgi:hypothetical protein